MSGWMKQLEDWIKVDWVFKEMSKWKKWMDYEWINEWMNKYLKGGKIECSIPDAKLISSFWIQSSKVKVATKNAKTGHFWSFWHLGA